MKRIILMVACISCFALIISCSGKSGQTGTTDQETTQPAMNSNSDITGTYSTTEEGLPMEFVLEKEGKGHENYRGEIRPFTWKMKEGKVFFVYDGEAYEWELPVFVDKGEIHYGSLVYKKQ